SPRIQPVPPASGTELSVTTCGGSRRSARPAMARTINDSRAFSVTSVGMGDLFIGTAKGGRTPRFAKVFGTAKTPRRQGRRGERGEEEGERGREGRRNREPGSGGLPFRAPLPPRRGKGLGD